MVNKQAEVGVDIVSDGEMSKISYATYIRHRLTGFEGDSKRPTPSDIDAIPDYRDKLVKEGHSATYNARFARAGEGEGSLRRVKADIARMKEALATAKVTEGFMNAVSPGTICVFQPNEYYPSHETYMEALAEAMQRRVRNHREIGPAAATGLPGSGNGSPLALQGS